MNHLVFGLVLGLLLLLSADVEASIGSWENLDLPMDYIGDFALLGPVGTEKKSLLVIIEGGFSSKAAGLRVVVVDVSTTAAEMTILSKETGYCPEIDGISFSPQAFMPINATSLALHCTANTGSSSIYTFEIDATSYSLVLVSKAVFVAGWEYALPHYPLAEDSPSESATLWFMLNSLFALTVQIAGVAVDTLDLVYNHTYIPGLDSASNFVLPPLPSSDATGEGGDGELGTAVLNQVYSDTVVDQLASYALPSSTQLHSLPNETYGYNSFAACSATEDGVGTGVFITMQGNVARQPTAVNISQCSWRSFDCGPPLALSFAKSAAYPGYSNGPIAAIWGSYAYVPFYVQEGPVSPMSIYQLLLNGLDTPPRAIDTTSVLNAYSRRILANDAYIFCDTDSATISRAPVA